MTRLTTGDLDLAVYDRQRRATPAPRVRTMVTAVRRLPVAPRDDTVIAIGVLHPQALSAAELAIAAEWERRADEAIRQIRAEHDRMLRPIREGRRA